VGYRQCQLSALAAFRFVLAFGCDLHGCSHLWASEVAYGILLPVSESTSGFASRFVSVPAFGHLLYLGC